MTARRTLPVEAASLPPFSGFGPGALGFLRGIAKHQDKAWMTAHKSEYEADLRAPFASLVAELAPRLAASGLPFRGDPQRALFRLNRDVRFSSDKRPYKTHAGASLTRSGDKMAPGVLYIHIDPLGSFTAAGFFRPEPAALSLLRTALIRSPPAWNSVIKRLAIGGLALQRDDTLIKPPKGFDQVPATIEADVRLKSWIVRRILPPDRLGETGLRDDIEAFAKAAAPLLKFGWAAFDP